MITLTRRYELACAHQLTGLGPNHKCARLHGHNYVVELTVATGAQGLVNGMVIDADALDGDVRRVLYSKERGLDHKCLNTLAEQTPNWETMEPVAQEGVRLHFAALSAQPTVENLALYLWHALGFLSNDRKQKLVRLRVYEESWLWAEVTQ